MIDTSNFIDLSEIISNVSKSKNENVFFDILFKNVIKTSFYPTDICYFKEIVLDVQTKSFIVENGLSRPTGNFVKNEKRRFFLEKYYSTISKSRIKIDHTWFCYFFLLQKAYCGSCRLFGDRRSSGFQEVWTTEYCDWKHILETIKSHEQSHIYYISCIIYEQWLLNKTLDEEQEQWIKKDKLFWRQVLGRVLNVTLTLAMHNLPFRGHKEELGSVKGESGHFICLLSYLLNMTQY